jgi:hypothetical protein
MTRQIKITQIADHMRGEVQQLVVATTLEWERRVKEKTPVGDTGNLRNGWRSEIRPFLGEVINPVEYAEPVCFGNNLPPSWQGKYRTRQGTVPGFPELIGKELEVWSKTQYRRIVAKN